jgi:Xaa-Pro aminopeptidase
MNARDRIEHRISDDELARRWREVRSEMDARGLDAIVMQSQNDWLGGYVRWFADLPATNGYPVTVVFPADDEMIVVDMGPFGGRRAFASADEFHRGVGLLVTTPAFTSVDYTNGYHAATLIPELRSRAYRRIGMLAGGALPHGFVAGLRDGLPSVEFLDATDWVDEIKAVKSREEMLWIRRVAAVQDQAFAAVLSGICPGLRDHDVASLAWVAAQRLGSEQGITLGCSAPLGQRASFVGRHLQGRRIEKGDHFSLLIEVNGHCGYYAELARTIVLGQASPELLDGFAAMAEAQAHTLSLLRPGADCAEIAAAHDAWMVRHGLPPEKRLYSHGQGADMVERPLIRHDETMRLKANMSLAVHPGYETAGLFAVICDNYIIEETGPSACLHQTEKRVFEVT